MESDTSPLPEYSLFARIIKIFTGKKAGPASNSSIYKTLSSKSLKPSEQEMIRGVLKLSDLNAREIMIPRVDAVAIPIKTTLKEIVNVVYEAGHSRIPVFEDTIDNISGILYVKDLLEFITDKRKKFDLKKLLHKPLFIPETMPLNELLLEFQRKRQHLAIVIDEYGGIAGIITMEDILEEIVGDINDEFDENELPEIIQINKNSYDIDSRMTIDDLNMKLELDLPSDEFDTLGGFALDVFGKIPVKDDTVKYKDISLKIKEIDGTRINRIILTVPGKNGSTNANPKN
ncbi:MAG: HlyC/CorC family transporter [Spirochaetes bacterium]|nr:HlyC/CorC family transporter [Spirochaetota bacterium]